MSDQAPLVTENPKKAADEIQGIEGNTPSQDPPIEDLTTTIPEVQGISLATTPSQPAADTPDQ